MWRLSKLQVNLPAVQNKPLPLPDPTIYNLGFFGNAKSPHSATAATSSTQNTAPMEMLQKGYIFIAIGQRWVIVGLNFVGIITNRGPNVSIL
jgi:hypothetical protein